MVGTGGWLVFGVYLLLLFGRWRLVRLRMIGGRLGFCGAAPTDRLEILCSPTPDAG